MDEELRDDYFARLRERLGEDFRLLRAAVAAADPEAKVPCCPDWTANQLAHHVAQTYLHKVECIRRGAFPEDWPPTDLDPDPVGVLDESFAALTAVFDEHRPSDAAATWHSADQTVGFWIRRMCQETVVHRVDGEQTAGLELAPIPPDIALDGIDEFLDLFIGYLSVDWPEHFTDVLAHADQRPFLVSGGGRAWTIEARPTGVSVQPSIALSPVEQRAFAGEVRASHAGDASVGDAAADNASADNASAGDEPAGGADDGRAGGRQPGGEQLGGALVEGEPEELLLWLWGRLGDRSVRRQGDAALLEQFVALRKKATQ